MNLWTPPETERNLVTEANAAATHGVTPVSSTPAPDAPHVDEARQLQADLLRYHHGLWIGWNDERAEFPHRWCIFWTSEDGVISPVLVLRKGNDEYVAPGPQIMARIAAQDAWKSDVMQRVHERMAEQRKESEAINERHSERAGEELSRRMHDHFKYTNTDAARRHERVKAA